MDKILVDTSAWIEFFRKKEPYYAAILELIDSDRICCVGIVVAELLQGAKSDKELTTIKEFLHVFDFLPESADLWEEAGVLSYSLQRKGKTAGLSDCYIAEIASSHKVKLLTLDKHFSIIRRETEVQLFEI